VGGERSVENKSNRLPVGLRVGRRESGALGVCLPVPTRKLPDRPQSRDRSGSAPNRSEELMIECAENAAVCPPAELYHEDEVMGVAT